MEGLLIAAFVLLQMVHPGLRLLTELSLLVLAMYSVKGMTQALSLSVIAVQLNTALANVEPAIGIIKWLVILACLFRMFVLARPGTYKAPAWAIPLGTFIGVTAVLAIFVSEDRMLSAFKLTSFVIGITAAMAGLAYRGRDVRYWLNWFFTLHSVVALLSVPVLFLPAGYWRTGWSFQGILCQPQAFGIYLGMFGAFLITYAITSKHLNWTVLGITGLTVFLIYSAHCRTAVLAFTLTVGLCLLAAVLFRRDGLHVVGNPVILWRSALVLLILTAALAYDADRIIGGIKEFAGKKYQLGDSTSDLVLGSVLNSRGDQIRFTVESLQKHPLAGVGFGIAPKGIEQIVVRDPVYGLPISAPSEEGFLPLSVLSQVGIIGAIALCVFVFSVTSKIIAWAPLPVFAMFTMAICINLGEMIFFATGDLGLHLWLTIGMCFEYSKDCEQEARQPQEAHEIEDCGNQWPEIAIP